MMKHQERKGESMKRVTALLTFPMLALPAAMPGAETPLSPQIALQNSQGVEARMAALRRQYAPFLESRPPSASLRQRQDLCGDDWWSRLEVKRVSDKLVKAPAPRPSSPGWEQADLDPAGWERTTVPEWRYDSHPRVSRDGRRVIMDSPHGGNGRQQYVVDISRIVGAEISVQKP
jgi:hypothetical protein